MRIATAALAATLLLAGCGTDDSPTAGTDAETESPATPTAEPTVGTYPSYAPEDYAYTLHVTCFCAGTGGIRVTVEDGEVTSAVYARSGRGYEKGDPAEEYRRLTINDVIDAANDTDAARVEVTWPDGQDYPTRVYVDLDERMVDEEVGYEISDVTVEP